MIDELPEGWAAATIREVIDDVQPGFASGEKSVAGGVAHLRMNNIGTRGEIVRDLIRHVPAVLAKPRHDLRRGDVLVCTTNSSSLVGKCAHFDLEGRYAFSNHLTRLRPTQEVMDGRFLRWNLWLQWRRGEFDGKCKHWVNQSSLPREALLESEIVVPPLTEQRRILVKLEELLSKADACQQRLTKVPGLLKRFRQSVLSAACSGGLTADWRVTNGYSSEDAEWPRKPALEACETVQSGSTPPSDRFRNGGQIPFLKVYNIVNQAVDFKSRPQCVDRETHQKLLKRSIAIPGDVLMNIVGPPLGKVAIVPSDYPEWNINQAIVLFRPKSDLSPKFLYYQLCSGTPYADILLETRGSAGQSNISLTQCREMMIPVPSMAEQLETVARVERLLGISEELRIRTERILVEVDKLKPSLLEKAFRGELVPTEAALARQESRDCEPPEGLREKLRRERV